MTSQKMSLKVTIITAVKNVAPTVDRCLSSILSQTYKFIEIIIIDGESTDNTVNILNEKNAPNVKIYSFKSLGVYDALNKGIELSTGDIIGILHGDDYLANENVISDIVKTFETTKVPIVIGQLAYFSPNQPRKIVRLYEPTFFKNWMFRLGMAPPHPSFYVDRKVFELYGNYRVDLEIAGDFDLMLRFLYFHKLAYRQVEKIFVMMSLGGRSTKGLRSLIKNNKDILEVGKTRNFYINYIFLYARYFFKIFGVLARR